MNSTNSPRYLPVLSGPLLSRPDYEPHEKEIGPRSSVLRPEFEVVHHSRRTMAATIGFVTVSLIVGLAGVPMINAALGPEMAWWMWATFPMSGAFFGLAVLVWYGKKDEESRKRTKWTAVFGLVGSIVSPRTWLYFHPAIASSDFMRDPIILWGIGFGMFLLWSGIAVGIMRYRDRRGAAIGEEQAEKWVKKAGFGEEPKKKDDL